MARGQEMNGYHTPLLIIREHSLRGAPAAFGSDPFGVTRPPGALDRLRSLGWRTVPGNADACVLEVPEQSNEPISERQLEVREWTLEQLDAAHQRPHPEF